MPDVEYMIALTPEVVYLPRELGNSGHEKGR